MRIGVPKERSPGERRVALTPETVKRVQAAGHGVVLEAGAGAAAGYPDTEATMTTSRRLKRAWVAARRSRSSSSLMLASFSM